MNHPFFHSSVNKSGSAVALGVHSSACYFVRCVVFQILSNL